MFLIHGQRICAVIVHEMLILIAFLPPWSCFYLFACISFSSLFICFMAGIFHCWNSRLYCSWSTTEKGLWCGVRLVCLYIYIYIFHLGYIYPFFVLIVLSFWSECRYHFALPFYFYVIKRSRKAQGSKFLSKH